MPAALPATTRWADWSKAAQRRERVDAYLRELPLL